MAILEIALAYCLFNEGSEFTNIAADAGGPTRYGVTQRALSAYLGRPASADDVKALSEETVEDVYRKNYWNVIKGDSIKDQNVATAYFDMAVNMGPSQATKIVQGILGVVTDGLCGPKTIAALNAAKPKDFLIAFSQKACLFYGGIATRNVTQMVFLAGWQIRAHRMIKELLLA